jgi:pimeloyl-ACP methyl ester carboxylesterase
MMRVHVSTTGSGPRVVFVHGSMTTSSQSWQRQQPLAERWTLVIVDRRGYEPNPPEDRSDFVIDGEDIAELLEPGDHLVAHSYGTLGAMFAVAARPDVVRSLTLVEPSSVALVRGQPEVERNIAIHTARLRDFDDPRLFHVDFATQLGADPADLPDPLPPSLERLVKLVMHERPPWEAMLPLDALQHAEFPKLIVSGGWDPGLEEAADALTHRIGSRVERDVITGKGHVVQRTGAPFNDRLERFLVAAQATEGNTNLMS